MLYTNPMIGGKRPHGFTIVEVVIVLGVTSALFISTVLVVNGRQATADFDQAIGVVQSRIQQVMDDVTNGFYPLGNSFTCTAPASGEPNLSGPSMNGQGQNSGCVFLGKIMQFDVLSKPQTIYTYSLVGRQCTDGQAIGNGSATCDTPKTLADAYPVGLLPSANPLGSKEDSTETTQIGAQLEVVNMYYNNNPAQKTRSVAFITNPSSLSSATNGITAGTESAQLYVDKAVTTQQSQQTYNGNLDCTSISCPNYQQVSNVNICLSDGSPNRSALIDIGDHGRQLAVNLSIKGTAGCS